MFSLTAPSQLWANASTAAFSAVQRYTPWVAPYLPEAMKPPIPPVDEYASISESASPVSVLETPKKILAVASQRASAFLSSKPAQLATMLGVTTLGTGFDVGFVTSIPGGASEFFGWATAFYAMVPFGLSGKILLMDKKHNELMDSVMSRYPQLREAFPGMLLFGSSLIGVASSAAGVLTFSLPDLGRSLLLISMGSAFNYLLLRYGQWGLGEVERRFGELALGDFRQQFEIASPRVQFSYLAQAATQAEHRLWRLPLWRNEAYVRSLFDGNNSLMRYLASPDISLPERVQAGQVMRALFSNYGYEDLNALLLAQSLSLGDNSHEAVLQDLPFKPTIIPQANTAYVN